MNGSDLSELTHRRYRSPLREQQAQATRRRILEAVHALLRRGDTALAYRSLAEEAGVSVPTVYSHFSSRESLLAELPAYFDSLPDRPRMAPDRDALPAYVCSVFARFDDPADPLVRAGRLATSWDLSRAVTVPERRRVFEAMLDDAAPGLRAADRTRLVDLCVVLLSTATGEAFRGYLGRSAAEISDAVVFGLDALFAQARTLANKETR